MVAALAHLELHRLVVRRTEEVVVMCRPSAGDSVSQPGRLYPTGHGRAVVVAVLQGRRSSHERVARWWHRLALREVVWIVWFAEQVLTGDPVITGRTVRDVWTILA